MLPFPTHPTASCGSALPPRDVRGHDGCAGRVEHAALFVFKLCDILAGVLGPLCVVCV